MKRNSLILYMVVFLALCLFGIRSAHATLVRVDFQLQIIFALEDNPFGVHEDNFYPGYTVYDDSSVASTGPDSLVIPEDLEYKLSVRLGNRVFHEYEDEFYDYPANYPLIYFKDGRMVGLAFWIESFDHNGYQDLEFDAQYDPDNDLLIWASDDLSTVVEGNFVNFSTPVPIPEPATMLLLGTGLAGLAGLRRKLRKG